MVALRLKLDNITNLPDGGPTSLEVQGRRSVDIGRNTYLDWTLPDPSRVVSGRHCEIHYRDGGYWLTDISTNGTFLNGADSRLTEPTRLKTGDRIAIGDYLINVTVEEDEDAAPQRIVEAPPVGPAEAASVSLWEVPGESAAPAERAEARKARAATPVHADVLDWISDLPNPETPAPEPVPSAPATGEAPPADAWGAPPTAEPAAEPPSRPAEPAPRVEPQPEPETPPAAALEIPSETPGIGTADHARAAFEGIESAAPAPADAQPEPLPGDEPTIADADAEALWEAPPAPPPPDEPDAPPEDFSREVFAADEPAAEPAPAPDEPDAPPPVPEERGFGPAVRAGDPPAPPPVSHGAEFERFVVALASALDVPRERLDARSPEELAERVGAFLNLTISGMQRLLKARAASRGYMRSGPGTQVQAVGNNPLKFMPTPGAAADVLFGPASRSYLGIEETLDESFADLGAHQMALYAAMQGAVERMLKDLDPAAIEAGAGEEKGFALPGGRKSKLWDTYKERYNARANQHDNGMVDVFMLCFSDAYDRAINNRD